MPACTATGYEAIRADQLSVDSIIEPIVSSLATSPLVVADLASPPWNQNVLVEVGFRLANGRPIVFLADQESDADDLPLHMKTRRILPINSAEPSEESCQELTRYIKGREQSQINEEKSSGWNSHYPIVEFAVPLGDNAPPAKFISANLAAARLYGVEEPRDLLAMPVEVADERLKAYMPPLQRQAFTDDQMLLFGQILAPGNRSPAMAKIPAWMPQHPHAAEKTSIYWPILLQHKFAPQRDSLVMRVAFVNVDRWDAWGIDVRELSKSLKIPDVFRDRKYDYDIFLSYNSADRDTVTALADALKRFGFRVWFDRDSLTDRRGIAAELRAAMFKSKILAAVLGTNGLGPWQEKFELRDALASFARGKGPFALLLLKDIPDHPRDAYLQYVPAELKEAFRNRLYVKLPSVDKLVGLRTSDHAELTLVERMVELLASALQAE